MPKSSGWILSAILAVCLVGTGWWIWNARSDSRASEASWLFSLEAESGTMTANEDGTYTLVLQGADSDAIAFTDRPVRDAGVVVTASLVAEWPQLFQSSPPNAVVVQHGSAGSADSVVVTLESPTVQGSDVVFTAKVVEGAVPDRVMPLVGQAFATPPEAFTRVTLFVDGTELSPVEQGILTDLGYQTSSSPGQ